MRAKVKIATTKDEIILTVREATIKEILYDLNSKELRLGRLYAKGIIKTVITGRFLNSMEKEKITRTIYRICENADIEFRNDVVNNTDSEEKVSSEITEKSSVEVPVDDLGLHAIRSTYEREIEISQTKFIHGNLRSGQREEFVGSLVVLGDLNYGAEIVAGENIIVTGTIRGLAHAGANGNRKAFIAGHAISCTQVRIANVVKEVKDTEGKFPFIYLENDDIYIEANANKGVNELKNDENAKQDK